MATTEEDLEDILSFNAEESEVEDTDDGGAIVKTGPDEESVSNSDFFANIVSEFSPQELEELASNLFDDIERDKKTREKRDKQYAEAIKRTGLGKEAPGGADFEGSSDVVHPMLTEACVDFASRTIKELMPSNGPVKVFVPGKHPSSERLEKAERKKTYMNWQFLVQMPDFRTELEQLLTQLPLGGSQYLRLVWDSRKKRPVPVSVPIDDIYLPYSASNFYTSERMTYVEHITSQEFEARVKEGMYEVEDPEKATLKAGALPEQTDSAKATDRIEGKEASSDTENADGLRDVFEVSISCDLEEDYEFAPYRITLDGDSRKIIAINRNWMEDDDTKENLFWIAEFQFVPWRGAYSIGLGQMIGSLAGAATGALRALLDSALINNMPTLLKLKGANFSGQTKELNICDVTEIEGGIQGDDIRKLLMAVPFNPPSPVLFQLLGFLVEAGNGVVRTTFDKLSDQNPNMPVGTTLALIEEGMQVLSGIHLRLYHSMTYVLRILNRINQLYIEETDMLDDDGELMAHQSDFDDPLDVVPVADPQVFSDVQRLAQLQVIAERATMLPHLYNQRKIEERILERTKVPNPDELLLPAPEPEVQNPVNENAAMTLKQPVAAFPDQDHLAHIQVHLDYLKSPILGMNQLMGPSFIPACLDHLKEHMALWYVNENIKQFKAVMKINDDRVKEIMSFTDDETRAEMARTLAALSTKVVEQADVRFAKVPPILQQAMEFMQKIQPPPEIPLDPNAQAAVQAKKETDMAKIQQQEAASQRKQAADAQKLQVDMTRESQALQAEAAKEAQRQAHEKEMEFMKLGAEERLQYLITAREEAQAAQERIARLEEIAARERAQDERTAVELQSREKINREDNQTALAISAAEIVSGEKISLETGSGINPSE